MHTRYAAALLWGLAGCGGPHAPASPSSGGAEGAFAIRALPSRPPLLVVSRNGDPRPALAVAVAVDGGPAASEALAAVVEARLAAARIDLVDTSADRAGYRVRILLDQSATSLDRALAAVQRALLAPIVAGTPEARLAAARVAALRASPLDDAALLPVSRCSGAPGLAPSETAVDVATASGASQLETWRRASHGVGAVAFGVTGTEALGKRVEAGLRSLSAWPAASLHEDAWPAAGDTNAAYVSLTAPAGVARLSAAFWFSDREAAMAIADELGDARAALLARLRALPVPFQLRRVVASARRTGACLLLEAETAASRSGGAQIEEAAGGAGALIRHEVSLLATAHAKDSSVTSRHIRALGDPREAAAAAAWWALSSPGPGGRAASHVALGLAPPAMLPPRASAAEQAPARRAERSDIASHFADALRRADAAWSRPAANVRTAVEAGQGELWLLVASACPSIEGAGDAGTSALAMTAAALGADGHDGVRLEPWAGADGAGLLAHAAYARRGESPIDVAARVANVAGRAFAAEAPDAAGIAQARSLALGRLDERAERARGEIAEQLAPERAGVLFPWGVYGAVARASVDAVRFRWARLGSGPLRVAVLANDGEEQGTVAAAAIDRWVMRPAEERTCPVAAAPSPYSPGLHVVPVASRAGVAGHAFVVAAVDAGPATSKRAVLATAGALNGPDGLLLRALAGLPVRAEAWIAGRAQTTYLTVEARGPDEALENAALQIRALLERLANGAATEADLERARAASDDSLARLDPRQRVVDLWRAEGLEHVPMTLASWRAWHSSALREDKIATVLERPGP